MLARLIDSNHAMKEINVAGIISFTYMGFN